MLVENMKSEHDPTNVDIKEQVEVSAGAIDEKIGTKYDQRDMVRMGKRQELRVIITKRTTAKLMVTDCN